MHQVADYPVNSAFGHIGYLLFLNNQFYIELFGELEAVHKAVHSVMEHFFSQGWFHTLPAFKNPQLGIVSQDAVNIEVVEKVLAIDPFPAEEIITPFPVEDIVLFPNPVNTLKKFVFLTQAKICGMALRQPGNQITRSNQVFSKGDIMLASVDCGKNVPDIPVEFKPVFQKLIRQA